MLNFSPPPDTIEVDSVTLLPTVDMSRVLANEKGNDHNPTSTSLEHAPVQSMSSELNEVTSNPWLGTIPTNTYSIFSRLTSFDITPERSQDLQWLYSTNHVCITALL